MVQFMKEITKTVKRKGWEISCGLMGLIIEENFLVTISKGMVFTYGLTVGLMRASGSRIKCMEREFSNGLMENFMMESTFTIRRPDMVFLAGQMDVGMKVSGWMENSMEREQSPIKMETNLVVCGNRVRGSSK
jgi:hypothetical protein